MIKGILFDYDGTLSCRYQAAYEMYRMIVEEALPKLSVDSVDFEMIVQKCMIWDEYGNINKAYVFNHLKEEFIPDLDIEYWKERWSSDFRLFQKAMPGMEQLLSDLSQRYVLGVITNGDGPSQNAKLDALGIREYFKVVITGGEFGVQKPDPSIYRYAAEQLKLSCDEIAFIGDTFATDIAGAIKAGMYPVWMCHEHKGISRYAVKQITDLEEVREIFLK